MTFDDEVEIAANAMAAAALTANRKDILPGDCRVLARIGLEALAKAKADRAAKTETSS